VGSERVRSERVRSGVLRRDPQSPPPSATWLSTAHSLFPARTLAELHEFGSTLADQHRRDQRVSHHDSSP